MTCRINTVEGKKLVGFKLLQTFDTTLLNERSWENSLLKIKSSLKAAFQHTNWFLMNDLLTNTVEGKKATFQLADSY